MFAAGSAFEVLCRWKIEVEIATDEKSGDQPHWLITCLMRSLGVAFMFGGLWVFVNGSPLGPFGALVGVGLLLHPARGRRFVPSHEMLLELIEP